MVRINIFITSLITKLKIIRENMYKTNEKLPLLKFESFDRTGMVEHGFTTRDGGVSSGYLSSLNLGWNRGDDINNVRENYRRLAEAIGTTPDHFVKGDQTHTANVRIVTEDDMGKGITRDRDYSDVDGLITNVPGIALVTLHADCVPLYFLDPEKKAIGMTHAGWRGTVQEIARVTVESMKNTYGSDPADIICAIGPSICQNCYEVGQDVADEFYKVMPGITDKILRDDKNGHYHLNLWEANRQVLLSAGILEGNISVSGICTYENSDMLFSHRKTNGKRGNCGAVIMLK
jgi:YfiH family protein